MKTRFLQLFIVISLAYGMAISVTQASDQAASVPVGSLPSVATPPQLAYGVSQILQLNQAKVGDDTIVAYIRNSGNSYGLDADQIIYLRQQGVSEPVITAMLNQPKPGVAPATVPQPGTPPPEASVATASAATYDTSSSGIPTTTVSPPVTYVQPSPAYSYYPYYYPNYSYYPYYYGWGYYPGVSISLGFGGGCYYGGGYYYRGGCYYRPGCYYGGYHYNNYYGGGYHYSGGYGGGGYHGTSYAAGGYGGAYHSAGFSGGGGFGGGFHGGGGGFHR